MVSLFFEQLSKFFLDLQKYINIVITLISMVSDMSHLNSLQCAIFAIYLSSYHTEVPVEQNLMIPVQSQTVSLGKPQDFPSYGWNIDYSHLQMK